MFLVGQISGADLCIGFAKGMVLTGTVTNDHTICFFFI